MSGHVISELFQQIVHSEERIKQRFEALKKVNQNIQDHQDRLRETKYEVEALQGSLSVLNHKLVQEEIELKWLAMRETILKGQKEESCRENADLRELIEELNHEGENEREAFLKECDKFLKEFPLTGECEMPDFEGCLKEKLRKVKEEHGQILKQVAAMQTRDEKLKLLEVERDSLNKEVSQLNDLKEALVTDLCKLKKEKEELKIVKEKVAKKSTMKPELHQMLTDLEDGKNECAMLSEQHQTLAKELYQLQQTFMKNEHRAKQNSNPWYISKQVQQSDRTPEKSRMQDANQGSSSQRVSRSSGKKLFNYQAHKKAKQMDAERPLSNESQTKLDPLDSFDFGLDAEDDSFLGCDVEGFFH
ncbi:golgin subfamily A member 6-like protein 4 [Hydractinia symbiolongicarpus]|uniref:golgin subfamily A member 6-like protein 4 n=1 Tax=Hydractinia symbiolongicarpus TaxID=13093 RepID=UPI00254EC32E|nr:golgin subfamily A member 6-like protein 4 [Hydractinia symbiolongicarpus]